MVISLIHRSWGLLLGALVIALLLIIWTRIDAIARVGAGYKAKIACSEIFLADRNADQVIDNEFAGMDPLMEMFGVRVDREKSQTVADGPLRIGRAAAVYREGYGCTLTHRGKVTPLPAPTPASVTRPLSNASDQKMITAVDEILDEAFADIDAGHRGVVVLRNGELVAERYADGFSETTPLLSWSMAKSITATLIGAAVQRGLVDIDAPAPVSEWARDDARSKITWRHLLQMQSGLAFEENYASPRSDVNRMLFASGDAGAAAAAKPLDHAPDAHWSYSSGTSNLLSRTLKSRLEEQSVNYHAFGRESVFNPVGATSMIMEPDAGGAFVGSSFVYATARDWARLGQLYLQNGVWDDNRLLPENWAAFVATPAVVADGQYGGHFWLNRDGENGRERFLPGLPEDVYFMSGHEGQYVFIVPSADLVVVRLGLTRGRSAFSVTAPVLKRIYDAMGAT